MRAIQKQQEPIELTKYRQSDDVNKSYEHFREKDKIRAPLLAEQGHLCAYCMRRIYEPSMKIEHWQAQSKSKQEKTDAELIYKNMLAVCQGNEKKCHSEEPLCCDSSRGNRELKYNPANPAHRIESHIQYLGNGHIKSKDDEFDKQLNNVLNLNYQRLKDNRIAIVDSVNKVLNRQAGTRTPREIQRVIDSWRTADNAGKLNEYCGVVIYFLTKRLKRTR
jgi:uncharacterized protein (TIGR02646 family)